MTLCECGCGGEASPGRRFISGHNTRVDNPMKNEEWKKRNVEAKRINKEIKEGKRPAPELPFCACGCGGRVSKPGNRYIRGHHLKGLTKENSATLKRKSETQKENYATRRFKIWCKGLTKETNGSLMRHSEFLKNFYQDKNNHPFYGKHHTEESKQKNRESNLGRKPSDETRVKLRAKRKDRRFPRHHTKPELKYDEICQKNLIEAIYTGDGSFWIPKRRKSRSRNPDFIMFNNGHKFVIEIDGDYWHSPLLNPKRCSDTDYKERIAHYKKYGWICISFWESDIMMPNGEIFVLSLLKKRGAI